MALERRAGTQADLKQLEGPELATQRTARAELFFTKG